MSYISKIADAVKANSPEGDATCGRDELFLIYALLVLCKGVETTADDVHNAWSVWMSTKDADHESIVEFSKLDPDIKSKDLPYLKAIHSVAKKFGH